DREAEIVAEEERRQRDDDQVVEEEHPAGEEAGEVVEGDADERRGAARLADGRRSLRVRERHDDEEQPDNAEHGGRQAERVQRDDPEREVDRGGDLPVGDGGERRRVERPLQAGELAGHARRRLTPDQEVDAAGADSDEEDSDECADPVRRPGHDGDAEGDGDHPEDEDPPPVNAHHAAALPAVTITRHVACLSTKSTVSPKIRFRPAASRTRRGLPMTMISASRRCASSTTARPGLRARTRRGITRTPYDSPMALASSSWRFASATSSGRYSSS